MLSQVDAGTERCSSKHGSRTVSHYEDRGLRRRLSHEVFQLQDPIEDVNRALAELGLETRVVKVDDIGEAQARGVKRLPAFGRRCGDQIGGGPYRGGDQGTLAGGMNPLRIHHAHV